MIDFFLRYCKERCDKQVQDYLDRLNEYYETKLYLFYEKNNKKKYNNNRTNLAKLRQISDSLCEEYGFDKKYTKRKRQF